MTAVVQLSIEEAVLRELLQTAYNAVVAVDDRFSIVGGFDVSTVSAATVLIGEVALPGPWSEATDTIARRATCRHHWLMLRVAALLAVIDGEITQVRSLVVDVLSAAAAYRIYAEAVAAGAGESIGWSLTNNEIVSQCAAMTRALRTLPGAPVI